MSKASGADGIPVELRQTLENDAVKCCKQYVSKLGKLIRDHRKMSVFILIPKKGNAKECSIGLISHASKVMLKILQDRLHRSRSNN